MTQVFVLNGVNLSALGIRRPEVYGTLTLGDIVKKLRERFPEVEFEFSRQITRERWSVSSRKQGGAMES